MDLRCQYASTHCPNTRSLKISGELHRFCLFHRRSANAAQRRWKQKKQAEAAAGASTCSSEDEAISKPTKTKRVTPRRRRQETGGDKIKPEPFGTKRCRVSHEIAAPRCYHDIQPATTPQPFAPTVFSTVPFGLEDDSLPALFANDDLDLLNKLALETDVSQCVPQELSWASALPLPAPMDCWWNNVALHQESGVIV